MTTLLRNNKKEKLLLRTSICALVVMLAVSLSFASAGQAAPIVPIPLPTIEVPFSPLVISLAAQVKKEFVLDNIGWMVAKIVIKGITRSTVAWINSGFQGNPAFVTNPQAFFADLADQTIGKFIEGSDLAFVCSPFQLQIKQALILNRASYRQRSQCRLSDVIANYNNFIYGIENQLGGAGGWAGWWAVSTRDNPYSQYVSAEIELSQRLASAIGAQKSELDWGKGFLSWRDCSKVNVMERGRVPDESECPIATPGSVIEGKLSEVLNTDLRQLELADEFNEIVGALMSQLTTQVLSSTGLFGLSSPSYNSSGQSYLSRLYQEERTDYGQVRGVTVADIDKNLETEQSYLAVKGQSLVRLSQAETTANDIKSCYQGKLAGGTVTLTDSERQTATNEIQNASSTITNQIKPLRASINRDVVIAQGYVAELEKAKDDIGKISVGAIANFNSLVDQYLRLRSYLHQDSDVSRAQNERDQTVGSVASDLQSKLDTCRVFPQR